MMKILYLALIGLLLISPPGCRSGVSEMVLKIRETFWERVVYLEEYKFVTEEAAADKLPTGAIKISSRIVPKGANVVLGSEEYTETEKYPCGSPLPAPSRQPNPVKYCERSVTKTRNINGILSEDKEYITYERRRWEEADKSKAQIANGDETTPPSWNEPPTDNRTTRIGRRTDFYSVTLTTTAGEAQTYTRQVSFEEWQSYKKGQKVKATFASPNGQPLTLTRIN